MPQLLQIVDESGQTIGEIDKIAAHRAGGVLHRAISVFLFDESNRLLLQRRAMSKYHFAGRWANTCCSHPLGSETPIEAATRAARWEMGLEPTLRSAGIVTYRAEDELSGLTEYEFDHLFVGRLEGEPSPRESEVAEVMLVDAESLAKGICETPQAYAPWLSIILSEADTDGDSEFAQFVRSYRSAL